MHYNVTWFHDERMHMSVTLGTPEVAREMRQKNGGDRFLMFWVTVYKEGVCGCYVLSKSEYVFSTKKKVSFPTDHIATVSVFHLENSIYPLGKVRRLYVPSKQYLSPETHSSRHYSSLHNDKKSCK